MKNLSLLVVGLFSLTTMADVKLGYVNMDLAFSKQLEAQKQTRYFEDEENKIAKDENTARMTLEKEVGEYNKEKSTLKEAEVAKKEAALGEKINKLQTQFTQRRSELNQKRQEVLQQLQAKNQFQVESISSNANLSFVFNSGALLYASDDVKKNDLTEKLVAAYNAAYPVKDDAKKPAVKAAAVKYTPSSSANVKVGYINVDWALSQQLEAQKHTRFFEAEEKKILKAENDARTSLEKELADFSTTKNKLSAEARAKKEAELGQKINTLQTQFTQNRADLAKKRQEVLQLLQTQNQKQIEVVARKTGLGLVMNSAVLLYVSDAVKKGDATDLLVATYNLAHPDKSDTKKADAKGKPNPTPSVTGATLGSIKLGYVNVDAALSKQFEAQKHMRYFEEEENKIVKAENDARASIEKELIEFNKSKIKLAEDARIKKETALGKKIDDLQTKFSKNRADLDKKRQEILQDLQTKNKKQIENISKKGEYGIVVNSAGLMYVSDDIKKNDLTDKLVAAFNEAYPVKNDVKKAPAVGPVKNEPKVPAGTTAQPVKSAAVKAR